MGAIRRINTLDDGILGELERLYSALAPSERSVFNDPVLLETCWRVFADANDPFALVHIENDELTGAALFRHDTVKIGGRSRRLVVPLVFKCSEFSPVLVRSGREREFWDSLIRYLLAERLSIFLPRLLPSDLLHITADDRRVMRYGSVVNPICLDNDSAFDENINKKSLRRRMNWFSRNGELTVDHFHDIPAKLIGELVELHIERWAEEGIQSKFTNPVIVSLYEQLAAAYADRKGKPNGMVLTDIRFDGISIAMHVGFVWEKTFLYQVPAANIKYRDRWPGEVLMRVLFQYAKENGYEVFDLGFGGEWYKDRYANASHTYHNILIESSTAAAMTMSALTSLKEPLGKLKSVLGGETK